MAATKRVTRPGFEPAKGFPDPAEPKVNLTGMQTHYPATHGPVCNYKPTPTDAGAYDINDPSCPACAKWLSAARQNTAAMYPWTKQAPPAGE